MLPPPRFNRGLRIRLSSAFNVGGRSIAPGSNTLLCDNLAGSLNATQRQSFESILSVNRPSVLVRVALELTVGVSRGSPGGIISLLKGGRKAPLNPGQPYAAASVRRFLRDLALFPSCRICSNFGAKECDSWINMYPSSIPRALHSNSDFDHFVMVGDLTETRR